MSDFNAVGSSSFNAFLDSGFNARGRVVPFTLRFWFFESSLSSFFGSTPIIGINWFVEIEGGNAFLQSTVPGNVYAAHPPFLFSATEWNYFICGFDGTRLFAHLNGSGRSFSPGELTSAPFGPGFAISPHPRVDEVALWKNRVLSEAEVADDYNSGTGKDFSQTTKADLLAYWELEGTDGTEAGTQIDSFNGYELLRHEIGGSHSAVYVPGKFGEGLFGDAGTAFDGIRFEIGDPAFSFGDA